MGTAQIAGLISGEKLYQIRARKALPLLVRQARSEQTIFYSDLAAELKIPNPRNLNYVLGCIGASLLDLAKLWKKDVPPIQILVVNKATMLPGCGIGGFLQMKSKDFVKLPTTQKKKLVNRALAQIFEYPDWNKVLNEFHLEHAPWDFSSIVESAVESVQKAGLGGGEGKAHRALKDYVAQHPELLKLDADFGKGETEVALPSGDFLDVSFQKVDNAEKVSWVAVEIKSSISNETDITRGIYQCVKYNAVMEAVAKSEEKKQDTRVVLLLEGKLPDKLVSLKNMLGVEVVDGVSQLK